MSEGPARCPRCKTTMEGKTVTLSRKDNATRVCGSCGVKERQYLFENPDRTLPDLNNPIPTNFEGV